ncbi:ankyrin repeat-containing domain protein [Ampelomyces quisqualis]|uniref:Ankyrin repeat-containing domain protein n=1 Tax=Ampelomyces quisqualis TaxID=50730 RepID=A0A6A5QQ60_AMPQU|nr:ankyrin repeat-containing domain protein [Ampelomyces quisqualis]
MCLSIALNLAIQNNDAAVLETSLAKEPATKRQQKLNECLTVVLRGEGSLESIKMLLDLGAKLELPATYAAMRREDLDLLQMLFEYGWNIQSTEYQSCPVQTAVNYPKSLRWLLDQGADPNLMSETRETGSCARPATPLARAAKLSDPTSLELLFSYGARMDPEAIFHAIGIRHQPNGTATLGALIHHGANVNHISRRWVTPLYHAVRRNQMEKLKLLLQHGADPDLSYMDISALDCAKKEGRLEMYELMQGARSQSLP